MMEDSSQLQIIFDGDIKTTYKECCAMNRSLSQSYKISLRYSSNTTSNYILKDILKRHGDIMDDQSSCGVDNLSGQINHLLPNKNMYKNCIQWKSSLRDNKNIPFLLNKNVHKCTKPPCVNKGLSKEVLDKFNCHLKKINLYRDIDNSNLKRPHTSENNNPNSLCLNSEQKKFSSNKTVTNSNTLLENSKNIEERPSLIKKAVTHYQSKQPLQEHPRNVTNVYLGSASVDRKTSVTNKIMKNAFKTAREELLGSNPILKKSLGISRVTQSKFVSPMMGVNSSNAMEIQEVEPEIGDERLKHIDPKMIELIQSEIIDSSAPVGWDDIAGLEMAKSVIQEAVVWPLMRPDIFTGLRRPPKGILLFGPPGTGKTLIGKCVASQCSATFFSISASSLTSKWIGDGEKMVRALFAVAKCHQPAVIFIDEIDSLLTQRSDAEHEATRRIKTEFLVQLDGAGTADEERLLIIGATNRPQELDEAARRRLVKRLYIPLPDLNIRTAKKEISVIDPKYLSSIATIARIEFSARRQLIAHLMRNECHELVAADMAHVAELTSGFSGADMRSLCSEAAMGPVRQVPLSQMAAIHTDMVRAVSVDDFKAALKRVRPSVSADDLGQYVRWNQTYGLGCHS